MKIKCMTKKLLSLAFAFILLCLHAVPVHAASTSVVNQGEVGAVDIRLHQSFPQDQVNVLPGQIVSIRSSVENLDQPAWIRVKLEYPSSEKEGLKELDDKLITFADGTWEKIGSYYYNKTPVESGEIIPFTEAMQFPYDWDNTMVKAKLGMVFTAEAVQEKNFHPDFDSDDPWHGAVIEAFDGDGYENREEGSERFAIRYKGGAEGMVNVGDDFFSNWENIMPGDELDGEAVIENRMNLPVEMYFGMTNEGNQELLDLISIRITNDDDVVYDGPLSGSIASPVLLKEYGKKTATTLRYHLSVSPDVDNIHALSDFRSVWVFAAKEIPPEEPDPVTRIIEIIKTGEHNHLIVIGILGLTAVTAGALYFRKRRRDDR